ncbi:MAG: GGDEF domain-containing protein [Blastochloris sp.]|nr:GGDEF domain-containing protein [Blastochloris sp.]
MFETTLATTRDEQQQRVRQYLRWHVLATGGTAILYSILVLMSGNIRMLLLCLVCSISLCFAAIAWRSTTYGYLRFAVIMLCMQLLLLPIAVAGILPMMYPVAVFVPLLAVAIHMPLLTRPSLIWLAVSSSISTLLTVANGLYVVLPWPLPPPRFMNVLVLCGFVPVISLNYVLFAQFKQQLVDLVQRLRVANQTLETKVQARTAALDAANVTLRELALRDPLTNLFNRRYVDEMLDMEIRRAQRSGLPVGLMLIDLDHFKQVNDTFGHDAGDALLQAVAALLVDHVRGGDIVARYGGEEFLMVLPGIPWPALVRRAARIGAAVRAMQVVQAGQDLGTRSCSIGVAVYPVHGLTTTAIITAADQALYQAKAQGRDQVVVATGSGTGPAVST